MYGKRKLAALAGVAALSLALAACSSDTAIKTKPKTQATATTGGEFGTACAVMPTDPANPGSFSAMTQKPVATAAAGNPHLSTLVAAVRSAGLTDTLNSAPALTVFAPTNEAFNKIPKADLDKVLADKAMLKKILTYHVVAGELSPAQLDGAHKTIEGADLKVTGSWTNVKVNNTATIVCGNVRTKNGTVYMIDTVLMPPA